MTNKKQIYRRTAVVMHELPPDLHPVLAQIYSARHLIKAAEIGYDMSRLLPPAPLSGLMQAVELLADAVSGNKRIMIVADFDADGATSCALAVHALRRMGAADVRYVVPNRFEYGYGLTPEIVALAADAGPHLIVTVDNGISSIDGVRAAVERDIKVLITDHHLPGASLPAADAIVNPNQPGDAFPSKNLAGVGVIFYVMSALRAHLRETGWFARQDLEEPNMADYLDLVALGTIADVAPLDYNNRILVAQGLRRINQGRARAGIQALLRVARKQDREIAAMDLGYLIAPRLNAAGRLEDMSFGIECLLAEELPQAQAMAARLDELNRERRAIEAAMQEQALASLDRLRLDGDTLPRGLCLFEDGWHQGVIGLVASRIKERVHRPVIAFARASDTELKGSARSISGLHIRDTLDAVAARHPDVLQKFGGHAMAAGLTLRHEHLAQFRAAFDEEVGRRLSDEDLQGKILSDGELAPADLSLDLAVLLREAGPWGQGFPEPVFDGHFEILGMRIVGGRHLKLSLRHPQGKRALDAIAFNQAGNEDMADGLPFEAGQGAHFVYRLDVNEYQGYRSLQLIIEHIQPLSEAVTA